MLILHLYRSEWRLARVLENAYAFSSCCQGSEFNVRWEKQTDDAPERSLATPRPLTMTPLPTSVASKWLSVRPQKSEQVIMEIHRSSSFYVNILV